MTTPLRFQVAPASGVPIYRQLMDQINAQIAGGRLRAGELLPSVRQIARELQVNPMTVSKAYSLLERDHVLERDRGLGMRVAERTTATNGSLRQRQQQLRPVLAEIIARAYQLKLTSQQVRDLLEPLLEDLDRE